jgi:isopentenyl-diphosphate delta-isomerase
MSVSKRKAEHIQIVKNEAVEFERKSTGFEYYDFIHCALPEAHYDRITPAVTFLGKSLSFPLLISPMTGGFHEGEIINRQLAQVCHHEEVALGVGSQRQILEDNRYVESYRVVRKSAPKAVIIGNIGAAQIATMKNLDPVKRMVEIIEADAMAIHLNPLQEILQPDGDRDFRGVRKRIEQIVGELSVPVIVKEVGCGISASVALQLVEAGVSFIDVAGAGGTSWAAIEAHREKRIDLSERFREWGIPTAQSLERISRIKGIRLIASGGIRDGQTIAKALALGAEICGAAYPFLKKLLEEGVEGLCSTISLWREEFKMVLFLTGCQKVSDLTRDKLMLIPAVSPE